MYQTIYLLVNIEIHKISLFTCFFFSFFNLSYYLLVLRTFEELLEGAFHEEDPVDEEVSQTASPC